MARRPVATSGPMAASSPRCRHVVARRNEIRQNHGLRTCRASASASSRWRPAPTWSPRACAPVALANSTRPTPTSSPTRTNRSRAVASTSSAAVGSDRASVLPSIWPARPAARSSPTASPIASAATASGTASTSRPVRGDAVGAGVQHPGVRRARSRVGVEVTGEPPDLRGRPADADPEREERPGELGRSRPTRPARHGSPARPRCCHDRRRAR